MRFRWTVGLALVVLLMAGCGKEQIQYRTDQSVGQAGEKIRVTPPRKEAVQSPGAASGPLYILHRWKEDDSLSFLAIYYTGKLEYQDQIEEANPQLTFSGRLPAGTPVWIPENIVRPEVKKNFTPVAKGGSPESLPASPLDRGVIHKAEGDETLSMVAAFYTGNAGNAEKLALYNPGTAPGQPLTPGQEVFIPAAMILKDLQPDLRFVSRPRPKELANVESSAVGPSKVGEEDLSQEPKTFDKLPPEQRPGYKPDKEGPQIVPYQTKVKPIKATKTTKTAQVKKTNKDDSWKVRHKESSKHKR